MPKIHHAGPVVVLVLSHRDPPLVQRLVDRVRTGDDVFVAVHHDPTGPPLELRPASNVALVPDPTPAPWGGFGLTAATWRSMQWVAKTVPELSWMLLVSGQDYPAMPIQQMEHELRTTEHDAFLRYFQIDGDPADDVHHWQAFCRTRYFHRRRFAKLPRSVPWPPRRHPFHGQWHAYISDNWFNLSRRAVFSALESPFAEPLTKFLLHSPIPEEMFIASLVCNDSSLDIANDRRRFLRFPAGAWHPEPLGITDVPDIVASKDFFARKFYADAVDALDKLDEVLS
jgi:hypothetical protein